MQQMKNRLDSRKEVVTLFFTNFKNYKIITKDSIDTPHNTNGVSKSGHDRAMMFMGNSGLTSYSEIPHELMHCLSLPHTFLKVGESVV